MVVLSACRCGGTGAYIPLLSFDILIGKICNAQGCTLDDIIEINIKE